MLESAVDRASTVFDSELIDSHKQNWSYTNGANKIVRILVTKSSTTTGSEERIAISEVENLCESGTPTIELNSIIGRVERGHVSGVMDPHRT